MPRPAKPTFSLTTSYCRYAVVTPEQRAIPVARSNAKTFGLGRPKPKRARGADGRETTRRKERKEERGVNEKESGSNYVT